MYFILRGLYKGNQKVINLIRKQSIWHRKCKLIYLYHYRQKKEKDKWTIADTARALSLSSGFISESIKLTRALSNNPTLSKLNRETALKVIKLEIQ